MTLEYKWIALAVMTVGTFIAVLDSTIVTLALPAIERDLGAGFGVEWVFTAYIVALGVSQLASGWVCDRFGRKAAFVATLVVFTVGSGLCGLAPSAGSLVAARVVQGLGGGLLIPVTTAMIFETFDPYERGRAMGIWGIALATAPALGPLIGGAIVETIGWRWVFTANVPIGVLGVAFSARYLRDTGDRSMRGFDVLGLAVASVGVGLTTVGLAEADAWGWSSPVTLTVVPFGVACLGWFVARARRRNDPLVNVRIFGNRTYALGVITSALIMVTQFGRSLFVPLELGSTRGIADLTVGFVLLPAGIGVGVFAPFGGRLTDRFGSRGPVSIGAVLMGAGFLSLSRLGPDTSLWFIAAALGIGGVGAGVGMMSPNIVAMNSVRLDQVNQASALTSVSRQIGVAVGVTGLVAIFSAVESVPFRPADEVTQSAIDPFNAVFVVCAAVMAVVLLIAQRLPGPTRMREMQAARAGEHGGA